MHLLINHAIIKSSHLGIRVARVRLTASCPPSVHVQSQACIIITPLLAPSLAISLAGYPHQELVQF